MWQAAIDSIAKIARNIVCPSLVINDGGVSLWLGEV